MSLAIIYSRACFGMSAPLVTVEVHISRGLPKFNIVGLAEAAVKESRDRVRSALVNSHFEFPGRRITVNLAPADLPKEGSRFDLPIAIGILAASRQLPPDSWSAYEFTGELSLAGDIRPVRGILPIVLSANQHTRKLILPEGNAGEASLANSHKVLRAKHLLEVCAHLRKLFDLPTCEDQPNLISKFVQDISDIKGQEHAKRALEIAAAGKHSLLLLGPPGTGKTMLASRLPTLLPLLSEKEALDVAALSSLSKSGFDIKRWKAIPFRAPHHTISSVALVGGGRPPQPGEISLAHHGILFLDELTEFNRHVLECLREPLESGAVTISRAAYQMHFPASFQLIAAMNPCPCGYAGSKVEVCECSSEQIKKYLAKISGPLLDRIDMHVEVPHLSAKHITTMTATETSQQVFQRVEKGRNRQLRRQNKPNTQLLRCEIEKFCVLEKEAKEILHGAIDKFSFSARAADRIIKVARTIADLEGEELIAAKHIAQSLNYRCLDKVRH